MRHRSISLIIAVSISFTVLVLFQCSNGTEPQKSTFNVPTIPSSTQQLMGPYLDGVRINDGDLLTGSSTVVVHLYTEMEDGEMIISQDPLFADDQWTTFKEYSYFDISGTGEIRIYAKIRDENGESKSSAASISHYTDLMSFYSYNDNYSISERTAFKVQEGDKYILYFSEDSINYLNNVTGFLTQLDSDFDSHIYPQVVNTFGSPSDIDGNGKIIIFFYPFDFAGGYFNPSDTTLSSQSNYADIIYITTSYFHWVSDYSYILSVIAHEFQHLCNNNVNRLIEGGYQDTWINEGFSEMSQELTYGVLDVSSYNSDYGSNIQNGHPLVKWKQQYADYTLSAIFMAYVRLQAGDDYSIFHDINMKTVNTGLDILEVMKERTLIESTATFPELLGNWTLARLLNEPSGKFGFMNSTTYQLNSPSLFTGSSSVQLEPGGSIYCSLSGQYSPSGQGSNMQYIGVDLTSSTIDKSDAYAGDRLIVYNGSVNASGTGEASGILPYLSPSRNGLLAANPALPVYSTELDQFARLRLILPPDAGFILP